MAEDKAGDAAAQAADAARADGQGGAADDRGGLNAEDQAKLNLAHKNAAEEARRKLADAERTIEDLRRQSPAAVPADPRAARREKLQAYAANGDAAAEDLIALRNETAGALRELMIENEFRDIADPVKRAKAREHYEKNRNRLADVRGALNEIDAEELRTENEKLRKEVEQKNASLARMNPNAPTTSVREVFAPIPDDKVTEMTEAEFDRDQAALTRAGMHDEKMRRQVMLRTGKIAFRD